jgi:hypothetical protein
MNGAAVTSADFSTLGVGDAAQSGSWSPPIGKGRHGVRTDRPFETSASSPRHMVIGSMMGCGKRAHIRGHRDHLESRGCC